MRTYRIYQHPDQRLVAIKEGFSFPGLIFGGFWLCWYKLWSYGAIVLIVGMLAYALFPSPEGYLWGIPYGHRFGLADLINLALIVGIGLKGNELRGSNLVDRGFDRVGRELANTPEGAIGAYLRKGTPRPLSPDPWGPRERI